MRERERERESKRERERLDRMRKGGKQKRDVLCKTNLNRAYDISDIGEKIDSNLKFIKWVVVKLKIKDLLCKLYKPVPLYLTQTMILGYSDHRDGRKRIAEKE